MNSKNFKILIPENASKGQIAAELAPVIDEILRYASGKTCAIISLKGDLAAGKTTLASAICQRLCAHSAPSPTFLKLNAYALANAELAGFCELFHYDFYNSSSPELAAALFEQLLGPGLHLAEWLPEGFKERLKAYGVGFLELEISILEGGFRGYFLKEIENDY